MNCNYPATIFINIYAQMYKFLLEKYIFTIFCLWTFQGQNEKIVNNTRNTYISVKILLNNII